MKYLCIVLLVGLLLGCVEDDYPTIVIPDGTTNIAGTVDIVWETNRMSYSSDVSGVDFSDFIVFGPVIINGSGKVTIEEGVTLDEATLLFWEGVEQVHGGSTNIIKRLAKEGHICEVLGHSWRKGRPGGGWYADYHPNTYYRTCRICGKCEKQTINDWK